MGEWMVGAGSSTGVAARAGGASGADWGQREGVRCASVLVPRKQRPAPHRHHHASRLPYCYPLPPRGNRIAIPLPPRGNRIATPLPPRGNHATIPLPS